MTRGVLRVALVGSAFMGRAHSQAWRTAPHFFDLPMRPQLELLVGRKPETTADRARQLGWERWSTDWHAAIADPGIDIIDICTPGDTHAEIAVAALEAGKHVLCEKPLANSVADAERMTRAAEAARAEGIVAMCGFSYRRAPALALARRFVAGGRLGAIRHVRAQYLQDWLRDPAAPLTWRLDKAQAGSGALGDIGAHSIDTAQWLTGHSITEVSATMRTFVTERPERSEVVGLGGRGDMDAARGPVTVDDAVAFTASFSGGALGVFEATRMATGRRNANRIELNGERGSIAFDFERMNELEYFDGTDADPEAEGFRRIQVTDAVHPYMSNWWPTGHGIGYEHLFTHQVVEFIRAIAGESNASPSFDEALDIQRVLAAVEASTSDKSRATPVERPDA
jgi:predicted dehydrogenase